MFALLADDGRGEHVCSKCGQGRVPTFTAPIIMRPPAFCIATVSLSLSLSLYLTLSRIPLDTRNWKVAPVLEDPVANFINFPTN